MVITMAEELRCRGGFVGGVFVGGIFIGVVFIGGVFIGGTFIGGALVGGDIVDGGAFVDGTIIGYCTVVHGQYRECGGGGDFCQEGGVINRQTSDVPNKIG